MNRLLYVAALATLAALTATAADPLRSPVPTIVCLDKSGSMGTLDGKQTRLQWAVGLLRERVKKAPPTKDAPLELVTFTDRPDPPLVFTDADSALKKLDTLTAGGGTAIAPALTSGTGELDRSRKAGRVEVMLISDFEDSDTSGLEKALSALNALFKSRTADGLANTVSVRVWADDETTRQRRTRQLIDPLTAGGVARGIDLTTTERVPVAVAVAAEVAGVRWATDGTVRVGVRATATPTGHRSALTGTLELSGDRGGSFRVPLDGRPHAAELGLSVSSAELATGTATVALRPPAGGFSEPFPGGIHEGVTTGPLTLTVPLPVVNAVVNWSPVVASPPRWVNLATDRAACEVELRWEWSGGPFVRPLKFALAGRDGVDVTPSAVTLDTSTGSVRVSVTGRVTASAAGEWQLAFTAAADPRQVVPSADVRVVVSGPPPVVVTTEVVKAGGGKGRAGGAVSAGTREVEFVLRPVVADASREQLQGLEFDLVTEGSVAVGAASSPDGSTPVRLTFPGPAPLTGYDQADGAAAFHPRGGATSVSPRPVALKVHREPMGVLVLTVALGLGVLAGLVWLAVRQLRPSAK